jgi:hypothetical protein
MKLKLGYWYASQFHVAGRIIIVNYVILASILYFIMVWTGILHALQRIKVLASYFLWAGREARALA